MRHNKKVLKLGRTKSHRDALLSNMASSLILHREIKTTHAKAKALKRYVERLITYGKKNDTHGRRLAFKKLRRKDTVTILFNEIAPIYENRNGGYTRIIKLGNRINDNAPVVLIQLVDAVTLKDKKKNKKKKKEKE
ncbi:MAG: 50S ribosomal protein L17 [Candidatus Marinimicrobia bacterium]|nr:50S ribosomal protein L17 [Candidatus Neomarinimicrobiota bacterium]